MDEQLPSVLIDIFILTYGGNNEVEICIFSLLFFNESWLEITIFLLYKELKLFQHVQGCQWSYQAWMQKNNSHSNWNSIHNNHNDGTRCKVKALCLSTLKSINQLVLPTTLKVRRNGRDKILSSEKNACHFKMIDIIYIAHQCCLDHNNLCSLLIHYFIF